MLVERFCFSHGFSDIILIPEHLMTCHHFPSIPSRTRQTPWKTTLEGPGWQVLRLLLTRSSDGQRGAKDELILTAPRPWGGVNLHLGNVRSAQQSPNGLFDFQQRGSGKCVAGWVREGTIPLCQLGQAGFGGDRGTRPDTWYLGCSASSLQGAKVWQALATGCLKCLLLAPWMSL